MKPKIFETPIEGLLIIEPNIFGDERGFFTETYHADDYKACGISLEVKQTSHSRSSLFVLRGLHYQDMTAPLAKLVRCSRGSVWDVAVDLRVDSITFGQWH